MFRGYLSRAPLALHDIHHNYKPLEANIDDDDDDDGDDDEEEDDDDDGEQEEEDRPQTPHHSTISFPTAPKCQLSNGKSFSNPIFCEVMRHDNDMFGWLSH